jgi:hypothetical protein
VSAEIRDEAGEPDHGAPEGAPRERAHDGRSVVAIRAAHGGEAERHEVEETRRLPDRVQRERAVDRREERREEREDRDGDRERGEAERDRRRGRISAARKMSGASASAAAKRSGDPSGRTTTGWSGSSAA